MRGKLWMLVLVVGCVSTDDGPNPHTKRANDLLAAGELDAAAEELGLAFGDKPDDYWIGSKYADTLYRLQRVSEARAILEQLVLENPGVGALQFSLANLEHNEGNLERAEELFRRCIRRLPNYVEAYVYLGIILRQEGRFTESMQVLASALSLEESSLPVNFELARTLEAGGDFRAREQWNFYAQLNVKKGGPQDELDMARKRLRALALTVERPAARYLLAGVRDVLRAPALPDAGTLPPEHLVPKGLLDFFDNPVFLRLHAPGMAPLTTSAAGNSLLEASLLAAYKLREHERFSGFRRRLEIDVELVVHAVMGNLDLLDARVDTAGRITSRPALEGGDGLFLHRDGQLLGWWLPGDELMRGPGDLEGRLASLGEEIAGAPNFWRRPGVELFRIRTASWVDGPEAGDLGELERGLPRVFPPTLLELEAAVSRAGKFLVRLQNPAGRVPAVYELGEDRILVAKGALLEETAALVGLMAAAETGPADLFGASAFRGLEAIAGQAFAVGDALWMPADPEGQGADAAGLATTAQFVLASLRAGFACDPRLVAGLRARLQLDGSLLLPPPGGLPDDFGLDACVRLALMEHALRLGDADLFSQALRGFTIDEEALGFWEVACLEFLATSAPEPDSFQQLAVELYGALPEAETPAAQAVALMLLSATGAERLLYREEAVAHARDLLRVALTIDGAYFCRSPGRAEGAVLAFDDPRRSRGWHSLVAITGLRAAIRTLRGA